VIEEPVCTCAPLVIVLASSLLASAGGGYGLGSWAGKTLGLMFGYHTQSAAELGGVLIGGIGFMCWLGYAAVLVGRLLA
jgi:hypothetical protein